MLKNWLDWSFVENRIGLLVKQIKEFEEKEGFEFKDIYGVPRGGLYLAVRLSYLLKREIITNKEEIGKRTLVVDDCTNTGRTLSSFSDKGFKTLVLVHRSKSLAKPTFYGFISDEDVNYFWEAEDDVN